KEILMSPSWLRSLSKKSGIGRVRHPKAFRRLRMETLEHRTLLSGEVIVTTTVDLVDGDISSIAALNASPGPDGVVSLREATMAADNTPSSTDDPTLILVPSGIYSLSPYWDSSVVASSAVLHIGNSTNHFTDIVGAGSATTLIERT